jgi:hypothetical protein
VVDLPQSAQFPFRELDEILNFDKVDICVADVGFWNAELVAPPRIAIRETYWMHNQI